MTDFGKLLGPMDRRINNMLCRGTVTGVTSSSKMQSLQLRLLAGEPKGDVEHFEPYGFTSCPLSGAEQVTAFFDGNRSHGVVLVVADRRYRLQGLKSGEIAIHDDQGQKVHLTRSGIVIDGAGLPLTVNNTPNVTVNADTKITLNTPELDVSGAIKTGGAISAGGDITDNAGSNAKTMAQMRAVHNDHDHNEKNVIGSPTAKPNQVI